MPPRVEMAVGHETPLWPLPDTKKRVASYGGLAFGARRASGARHHAGVDLLAPRGAVVIAPESGELVARQRFNGPNAHALLLQTDTGPVLLLGEVEPNSWHEFGLDVGSRVDAGMPVARVGINPGGSTMLHFETYKPGTTSNRQWPADRAPPRALLEPTQYLKDAAAGPVEVVPSDHPPDDPIEPDPVEPDPIEPDPIEPLMCEPGFVNVEGVCVPEMKPPVDPLDPFPDYPTPPPGPGPEAGCAPGTCPPGMFCDPGMSVCLHEVDPIEPILPPVIPGATPPEPGAPPSPLIWLALLAVAAS